MPKMIVIDGNSLLFRAYYATSYPGATIMRSKDGIPTNALFAFSNMVLHIIKEFKNDEHLLVAFDTDKKTFRHQEFDKYKANRKACPEELKIQMPLAREMLKALGVFTYEMEEYEGDDIAGTVAKLASKQNYQVEIYTSDRDFLQLIDQNIEIHILKKGMTDIDIVDIHNIEEKYGFTPLQLLDYKGLRGDASDNLPGIPGVGEKTALKLIQEYGNLEAIIDAAHNMNSKLGEKIIQNAEIGLRCKHLAEILIDVQLPFSLDDTIYKGYNYDEISHFCNRYELKQLLSKLSKNVQMRKNDVHNKEIKFTIIKNVIDLKKPQELGLAIDYSGDNYHKAEVYGLALTIREQNYYLEIDDVKNDETLKSWLEDSSIKKYCFDYKAIKVILSRYLINIDGLAFDVLLAAYLLDSSLDNAPESVFSFFNVLISKANEISLLNNQNALQAAEISYYSLHLYSKIKKELEEISSLELLETIEIPLATVLAKMEIEGFPLNVQTLDDIGQQFKDKLNTITEDIYVLAGEHFNISSPKQVAYILFDKLGLPSNKKGSTSIDYLKTLVNHHPIVPLILEHRKYAKLVSTYIEGLKNYIFPDGKLHAIFNQALTTTGRLSSSEPNLQNISVRDEEGKLIRKAFYYNDEDTYILSLDYSQIELRILASLSNCQTLIDAFRNDEDIHSLTARHVFKIEGEVPSLLRRKAKAVNFGIVYGISDWGLSEQIGVTSKEAHEIINAFYMAYPEIAHYLRYIVESAEKNGYVTTQLGRRRYLREIHDSSYQVREFAKRAAMNAPIQGSSADLIKKAMINVDARLQKEKVRACIISQIHDELLLKVHKDDIDIVKNIVREEMENAMTFSVPLKVDGSAAKTWYDAK